MERVKESKPVAAMKQPPRAKAKQEKPPMVSGHALMLKVCSFDLFVSHTCVLCVIIYLSEIQKFFYNLSICSTTT